MRRFIIQITLLSIVLLGTITLGEDVPTVKTDVEPLPKREAVDIQVEVPYEVISDANLIIMTKQSNARIDIYKVHYLVRGKSPIAIGGEIISWNKPYVDLVSKPIITNAKADSNGTYEQRLPPGVYGVGVLAKDGSYGGSQIIMLSDKPLVIEVETNK